MNMKNLNKIEEKILKYFNDNYGDSNWLLKHLDEGTNKKPYYTGVTFYYIYKYVLKKRVNKINTYAVLMNMVINKDIQCLYCGDVKDLVFENKESSHWKFIIIDGSFDNKKNSYHVEQMYKIQDTLTKLETSYSTKFQN